jgi:hypothetical protein
VKAVRFLLAALGAAGAAYGLWLLADLGPGQVGGVAGWVVGGIVVHDGLLAPLVAVGGVAVAVRGPAVLRAPLLWVVVVLGPLTLISVPVLGRFGAKPDNPTLLDRPYWLGYAAVVALVLLLIAAGLVRRDRETDDGRASARE